MTREELWAAWDSSIPEEFKDLKEEYRINTLCKNPYGFGHNAPHADYYDGYINEIYNKYPTEDFNFYMCWDGETCLYTGRAMGDAFVFSREGCENFEAVSRKPSTKKDLPTSTLSLCTITLTAEVLTDSPMTTWVTSLVPCTVTTAGLWL